jgi:hypothetical protein
MVKILLYAKGYVLPKAIENFLERKTQFYEQGATVRRIGQYVRNWYRWVRAGVPSTNIDLMPSNLIAVLAYYCFY